MLPELHLVFSLVSLWRVSSFVCVREKFRVSSSNVENDVRRRKLTPLNSVEAHPMLQFSAHSMEHSMLYIVRFVILKC